MAERLKARLMIIESNVAFRRQISERLRREHCRVFEITEDNKAQSLIRKNNIDVVLLQMREADRERSLSILRKVKETHPLTEVILMTPFEEHSLYASMEAMRLGAFDDLLTPFDMETLINRIKGAIRRKKEHEQQLKDVIHRPRV